MVKTRLSITYFLDEPSESRPTRWPSRILRRRKKAPRLLMEAWGLEKTRQYLLSRKCNIIGSSRFTTVFGMGTGMAKSLWSPGRRADERC